MSRDGNDLTGLAKLGYKPIGLIFGIVGGMLAGRVFGMVWKKIANENETPQPLSEDYSTREVLLAATLQGAIFGLIKTAVDRYGLKSVRHLVDTPPRRPVRGDAGLPNDDAASYHPGQDAGGDGQEPTSVHTMSRTRSVR